MLYAHVYRQEPITWAPGRGEENGITNVLMFFTDQFEAHRETSKL